ncbi:MAG: dipeptidase [Deltaproteobacteria bacterium]|nr:dipeptidase [Deltaproteobacteria bacterium]
MDAALTYAKRQQDRFLKELFDLLRIPSVSADPAHDPDTQRAAKCMADLLTRIGIEHVRLIPTAHNPIVYGDWLHAPGKSTILLYGHYDVQPPDPLDKWTSPPFEPTIRDGKIYARGSADNKGQIGAVCYAVESWLKGTGTLPCNVKFFIEGDEEGGMAGVEAVAKYPHEVACDAVVISDAHWIDREHPAIFYGMKGLCMMDVAVRGPNRDVHSGTFGNLLANPLNVLAHLLGQMCPPNAPIQIPGFYEDIAEPAPAERALLAEAPFDTADLKREYGVDAIGVGEPQFSPLERNWLRPTMDICGMWGGYQGPGGKTIIPSEAYAKVSFRIVPNQDPQKIAAAFERHFRALCPKGVTVVRCALLGGAEAALTPYDDPFLQAALKALAVATGKRALLAREPASIPISVNFRKYAKAPVLLFGMGYIDNDIHSPNEHLESDQFAQGIVTYIHVLQAMGAVRK